METTVPQSDTQAGEGHPAAVIGPRGAGALLLRALARGPQSVGDLVAGTGLSQPNVSNHLARLRERGIVRSRREGRQVIYQLASAGLAHFVAAHVGGADPRPALPQLSEEFLQAVLTLREEEAIRVVDGALAAGVSWRDVYLRVFQPAMLRVGELWAEGQLSVASEHLITAIVQRLLHRLSLGLPVAPAAGAPTALVGCVEGEMHTLGARMVADFLQAQGWRVWYLNGYLPADHLLEAVRTYLPDAIVLSLSGADHAQSLEATVARLRRWRGEQPLPLLVAGGRYFSVPRHVPGLDVQGTDVEEVTARVEALVAGIRARRPAG